MYFNVGDRVKFIDEEGGGVVTELLDDLMVMVETADGFDVPYMTSQLIKAGSFEKEMSSENVTSGVESEAPKEEEPAKTLRDLDLKTAKKEAKARERKEKDEKKNKAVEEIDLHIQNLVEDHKDMSPGEILDLQMSRFEIAIEGAIRSKQRKIVFIHGKGSGKLKSELQKRLKADYPTLRSQDASFREYSYGAMLVILPK